MVRQAHHDGLSLARRLVLVFVRQSGAVEQLVSLFAVRLIAVFLCLGSAKFLAVDGGLCVLVAALFCLAKFAKVDEVAHVSPDRLAAGGFRESGIDRQNAATVM